jgi:Flp pilus assembly protein TadG
VRIPFSRSENNNSRVRRAAAAVELAVVLPFMAALFVIAVDFSRVFYYQMTINNCARNGAVFGSNLRSYQDKAVIRPYDTITTAATADGSSLSPPLDATNVTVTNGTGSDGNPDVTVTINYQFSSITNFPGFGMTWNLQAQSSMRVAP